MSIAGFRRQGDFNSHPKFVMYNLTKGVDHRAAMTYQGSLDKKTQSGHDTCTKFIKFQVQNAAGWRSSKFYERMTLGMTDTGKFVYRYATGMGWDEALPLWEAASKKFALSAKGDVHVFLKKSSLNNPKSVWHRIEYPTLLTNDRVSNIIPCIMEQVRYIS